MGATARKRAQAVFDWKAVIPTYQALWGELAAIRPRPARPGVDARPVRKSLAAGPLPDVRQLSDRAPAADHDHLPGSAATRNAALKAVMKSPLVAYATSFFPAAHELETLVFRLTGARQMRSVRAAVRRARRPPGPGRTRDPDPGQVRRRQDPRP
ncbi:hypothetical protein, partial [Caulobacter sp. B11]|uniref:hypothetical protein n=1 Tax=Caulobacter sp. B11 TaxID=2048899 RepID=UPI00191BC8C1